MNAMQLWLVGQYRKPDPVANVAWEFQGVFTTKGKAIAACRRFWLRDLRKYLWGG